MEKKQTLQPESRVIWCNLHFQHEKLELNELERWLQLMVILESRFRALAAAVESTEIYMNNVITPNDVFLVKCHQQWSFDLPP